MSETKSYPLSWPAGWPRTEPGKRKRANFNSRRNTGASYRMKRPLTIAEGLERVMAALERMGIPDFMVIISTNMPVKGNGMPYSGRKEPDDPGAAVYWRDYRIHEDDPEPPRHCMAIDQYDRLADNLAAIGGTLEALRAVERWGGGAILERAFTGFLALPETASTGWWTVLDVPRDADSEQVELSFKVLRSRYHPDRETGDPQKFHQVMEAWQQYQEECR